MGLAPKTSAARRSPLRPATLARTHVRALRHIVAWYFRHYFGVTEGPGCTPFYCDPAKVGAFAVSPQDLAQGQSDALFKLAVGHAMYQTRRDVDIMASQARLTPNEVAQLTSPSSILEGLRTVQCPHAADLVDFRRGCDVYKRDGHVDCEALPGKPCVVKDCTRLMQRYGDFGKIPVSLALLADHHGVPTFAGLHTKAKELNGEPDQRAQWLEDALRGAWRTNHKIANFILSALSNTDLAPGLHPWSEGVDWNYYVVIDRHVARALLELGAPAGASYGDLRKWLFKLARRIDLREFHPGVHAYNPRLIQQALYRFRSVANRAAFPDDCMHKGPEACEACPIDLSDRCPSNRSLKSR